MVPELGDLIHEEIERNGTTPTLKQTRERGRMITVYKMINKMEVSDNDKLLLRDIEDTRQTGGYATKPRGNAYRTETTFLIEVWNNSSERMPTAKYVHKFKERLGGD